ncbi:MAG: histidinol-phosphate transaminase [Clostridia bacterium]|nr:histidinol-phosphate transaminase [Clostridia bacterium]
MSKFFSDRYASLAPYVPGEQPKEKKYIKLNTNESPFPPSKRAQKYAAAELKKLMLYPDPDCKGLTKAIANRYGVEEGQVIVNNGSDETLYFAFLAYCDKKRPAVFMDITYGFYKVFAEFTGCKYVEVPLNSDFSVPVDKLKKTKGTIFLANPNAPTGLALSKSTIEEIVAADRDRVVVVDEAYVDFGGESCVSLTEKYDNLLVTQTFSKSRSLAGARLGFGIADKGIIADLQRIKYSTNPYNVNRTTAAAGLCAMEDEKYFSSNCEKIQSTRTWTKTQLEDLGFTVTDSKANFLFAKSEKIGGEELYVALKENGVLVRHFTAEKIKDYNRITIGSQKEMQILVDKIKTILEAKQCELLKS